MRKFVAKWLDNEGNVVYEVELKAMDYTEAVKKAKKHWVPFETINESDLVVEGI